MARRVSFPTCPAFPFDDAEASHLVHDPVSGHWVILAPGRRYRPDGATHPSVKDPFSPSALKHERVISTIGKGPDRVTAIDNAYPVFHPHKRLRGRQEILVEGTRAVPFSHFAVRQIEGVLGAMAERCRAFRRDPDLAFMVAFKNEGHAAGASQPHPHSQLFGLAFVPEHIRDMAARRRAFRKRHGGSVHAWALGLATKDRTIYADRHVVAFAHPMGRLPYEVRIVPKKPHDNVTRLSAAELRSCARAIHALLPLVRERGYAYNLFFHDTFADKDEHFEIVFAPRSNVWGGFELDAGVIVNPVPAECAAAEYRTAKR